jgi:hypothetical protein
MQEYQNKLIQTPNSHLFHMKNKKNNTLGVVLLEQKQYIRVIVKTERPMSVWKCFPNYSI